ncbi:hypothetical protein GIB67_038321 [Kingdonia uniflora]|uniref:Uncharacterized protein n=1 Tax=Kingdonia uniflora TaxID=39325 RepID=A0A7J7KUJ3_9MAGN|nr:hypothetical protein GIB67_038321 [Kingdonia uniflora]
MVKTRSMVLEEKITSEAQRLKLKYFGDQSLEMAIPAPIPSTYRALLGDEAVEAEEDFYCWALFISTNSAMVVAIEEAVVAVEEENWIRHAAEGRLAIKTVEVRERIFGSLGYDAELPIRVCQLEGLDIRSRELEYARYFYESFFHVFMRNSAERERVVGLIAKVEIDFEDMRIDLEAEKRDSGIDKSISLEYFDEDVRSDLSEGFLCYLSQLEYGLCLSLTNLGKGVMNAIGACPIQMNGNMWEVITVCEHLNDRWERENKVRRITPEDILQFYGVKNFKASGGSYFCASITRRRFFDLNLAGVKSTVERKESLFDEVAEEETELKLALGELGLSRKKRVKSRSKKVAKAQSTRLMTGVDKRTRETSGDEVRAKTHGSGSLSQLNLSKSKIAHKFPKRQIKKALPASSTTVKSELEKNLARAKTDALKEVKQLKVAHAIAISQLQVEAKATLDEMAEERDRLVLDNQGDDVELPEGRSEKVVKEMSLRINDLEFGLVREIETSKALLSAQAELQVRFEIGACSEGKCSLRECQHKLDAALIRERILEGEIRANDLLVKRKDDLLKDLPAREELNAKLWMLHARVVELQAMNLVESEQYIAKLKEEAIRHDRIDADRNAWKDTYVSIKVRHKRLKARFAKVAVPDVA